MSSVSPKPIIAHVANTWKVPPGMTFALVEDMEGAVWIVESCPAGTHFWTVEQAAHLSRGMRTRPVLQEAVAAGRVLEAQRTIKTAKPAVRQRVPVATPKQPVTVTAHREATHFSAGSSRVKAGRALTPEKKLSVV